MFLLLSLAVNFFACENQNKNTGGSDTDFFDSSESVNDEPNISESDTTQATDGDTDSDASEESASKSETWSNIGQFGE